jgi:penicillin-binding protein 1A
VALIFRLLAVLLLGKDIQAIVGRLLDFQYDRYSSYIPDMAVHLLSAAEDRRFNVHKGFDPIGITRAIRNYILYSRIEGASTIEQQLVRVLTGRYKRTLSRKLREIMLATIISKIFDKQQLAKAYIFYGYYGWRMNGLKQACIRLRQDVTHMTELEVAQLIARLRYPEPHNASKAQKERIKSRAFYIISVSYRHRLIPESERTVNATI